MTCEEQEVGEDSQNPSGKDDFDLAKEGLTFFGGKPMDDANQGGSKIPLGTPRHIEEEDHKAE